MASTKGPRFQLEVQLPPDMTKSRFSQLLEDAKRLLTPPGRKKIDNYGLLTRLISVTRQHVQSSAQTRTQEEQPAPQQMSWQESSGQR